MDWYERNRERICAHKRALYHSDPALKERKKAQALASYYRRKTDSLPPILFSNQDNEGRHPQTMAHSASSESQAESVLR